MNGNRSWKRRWPRNRKYSRLDESIVITERFIRSYCIHLLIKPIDKSSVKRGDKKQKKKKIGRIDTLTVCSNERTNEFQFVTY